MGFIFMTSIDVNIAFHLYLRLGVTIATAYAKMAVKTTHTTVKMHGQLVTRSSRHIVNSSQCRHTRRSTGSQNADVHPHFTRDHQRPNAYQQLTSETERCLFGLTY